jgi:FdhD protein
MATVSRPERQPLLRISSKHMQPVESGSQPFRFSVLRPDGSATETVGRPLISEVPIAFEYNGIGYAVMMATPIDLEDFAIGFSLSEQLIDAAHDIASIDIHHAEKGWIVRVELQPEKAQKIYARARQRVSESSCGLCGMDNLDEVMRDLPAVTAQLDVANEAIFEALSNLREHQHLNATTGASHAAAFCAPDGSIMIVREDVGRHNALDKVIGALPKEDHKASDGFLLLTARCSFELAQKAILANCSLLVTISAATNLAVEVADKSGMRLISLARSDSALSSYP